MDSRPHSVLALHQQTLSKQSRIFNDNFYCAFALYYHIKVNINVGKLGDLFRLQEKKFGVLPYSHMTHSGGCNAIHLF